MMLCVHIIADYFVHVIKKCEIKLCCWLKKYTMNHFTGIDKIIFLKMK